MTTIGQEEISQSITTGENKISDMPKQQSVINTYGNDAVYLTQIQELVEKNEKMHKEQEQVKFGLAQQILKMQVMLGYSSQKTKNYSNLNNSASNINQNNNKRDRSPKFGGSKKNFNLTKDESLATWGGKEETIPITLQDSRTRDETKNNLSQPNDPSQSQEPQTFDLSKTNEDQDINKPVIDLKNSKTQAVDDEKNKYQSQVLNTLPNPSQDEQNDDVYTQKELMLMDLMQLIKLQDKFLQEMAPSVQMNNNMQYANPLAFLENANPISQSTYSRRHPGASLYQPQNKQMSKFNQTRGAAQTTYNNQYNSVDVDDNQRSDFFKQMQNHKKQGADFQGMDLDNQDGLIETRQSVFSVQPNGQPIMNAETIEDNPKEDQIRGRRRTTREKKKRPYSNMLHMKTQSDLLLSQTDMMGVPINYAQTPRGFNFDTDPGALSQSAHQGPAKNFNYLGMSQSQVGEPASNWVPDTVKTHCSICKGKFYFLRRRHHCRACGDVVCDKCSAVRDYVEGFQDKKVRVCTLCSTAKHDLQNKVAIHKQNLVMSAITLQKPKVVVKKK